MDTAKLQESARTPPVLIIGMHRSGTALVVQVLRRMGLFAGWKREPNEEATLFLSLNKWIFEQLGGRWDRPPDVGALLGSPPVLELAERYLRRMLGSWRALSFLGPAGLARSGSVFELQRPWGWKDPRTTITLPIWLRLFPAARVIHITRHGVDVARSLQVREERRLAAGRRQMERFSWLYPLRPKRYGFVGSLRSLSLAGGLDLWEEYQQAASHHLQPLGNRALRVGYEALLADPRAHLPALAEFCGLDAPAEAEAAAIVGSFDASRAFAYRGADHLTDFAARNRERLGRWGYSE